MTIRSPQCADFPRDILRNAAVHPRRLQLFSLLYQNVLALLNATEVYCLSAPLLQYFFSLRNNFRATCTATYIPKDPSTWALSKPFAKTIVHVHKILGITRDRTRTLSRGNEKVTDPRRKTDCRRRGVTDDEKRATPTPSAATATIPAFHNGPDEAEGEQHKQTRAAAARICSSPSPFFLGSSAMQKTLQITTRPICREERRATTQPAVYWGRRRRCTGKPGRVAASLSPNSRTTLDALLPLLLLSPLEVKGLVDRLVPRADTIAPTPPTSRWRPF